MGRGGYGLEIASGLGIWACVHFPLLVLGPCQAQTYIGPLNAAYTQHCLGDQNLRLNRLGT